MWQHPTTRTFPHCLSAIPFFSFIVHSLLINFFFILSRYFLHIELELANFEDCEASEANSEQKAKSVFEVERQNTCKYCLKTLKQAKTEQEKTLHEEKMHECDKCDELPKDAKSCDICFKIVTHLDIHKKLYHSDKNNNKSQHKCDKCDFKTKRKDSLLRHLRCVHNLYDIEFEAIDKTFENMDDLKWQCKQCKRIFKNAKAIEDHIVLKDCKELKCDTLEKCLY